MLDPLSEILEEARDLGFLGPGPVEDHVVHARGFAEAVRRPVDRVLDMGSGGGIPGLVLALAWPEAWLTLLDSSLRRTEFLRRAVDRLGVGQRVQVRRDRAEELAHEPGWRRSMEVVVSRSFGAPAVTAECAAPFLVIGGQLVVSEPPEPRPHRWPPAGLEPLGLRPEGSTHHFGHRYQILAQASPCPERIPRRPGLPAKRPLF